RLPARARDRDVARRRGLDRRLARTVRRPRAARGARPPAARDAPAAARRYGKICPRPAARTRRHVRMERFGDCGAGGMMANKDPRVDAYIAKAADFARPIL